MYRITKTPNRMRKIYIFLLVSLPLMSFGQDPLQFSFESNFLFLSKGERSSIIHEVNPYVRNTLKIKTNVDGAPMYIFASVPLYYGLGADISIVKKKNLFIEPMMAYDWFNNDILFATYLKYSVFSIDVSAGAGFYMYHNTLYDMPSIPIVARLTYKFN